MDINDERVKRKLKKLDEIQEIQRDKYFSWLRNIITLAVAFLGIIVSLKSDKQQNSYQHIFFVIAVGSLAVGILTGIIVLYSEIHVISKVKKRKAENILKMVNDEKTPMVEWIGRNIFFQVIEYLCFISFSMSLISLVIYSSVTYK